MFASLSNSYVEILIANVIELRSGVRLGTDQVMRAPPSCMRLVPL